MVKHFFSTLAAILVAAAVIYGIKSCADESQRLAEVRAYTEQLSRQSDAMKKSREQTERIYEQVRGRTKPTPLAAATPRLSIAKLTKPVNVPVGNSITTLPIGTEIKIVANDGSTLMLDYGGRKIEIPIDAADVK